MIYRPKGLHSAISKGYRYKNETILDERKKEKLRDCIKFVVANLYSIMGDLNTNLNESIHYLMTRICPKDVPVEKQFEGKMAYTTLLHNLGRDGALAFLESIFNVTIPKRISLQAISSENKRIAKREWEATFMKDNNIKRKANKRHRKSLEDKHKKKVQKERQFVEYGVRLGNVQNDYQMKEIIAQVPNMKVYQLDFYLEQFQVIKKVNHWKKKKRDQKIKLLKLLLEEGESVALMQYPELFK